LAKLQGVATISKVKTCQGGEVAWSGFLKRGEKNGGGGCQAKGAAARGLKLALRRRHPVNRRSSIRWVQRVKAAKGTVLGKVLGEGCVALSQSSGALQQWILARI